MRYKVLFTLFLTLFSNTVFSNWKKINDVDYTWGPFKIYNITLSTETGEYSEQTRPLMLTLKYDKPVDGRDFAISIARSWARLDINVPDQNAVIDRLRKQLPDLKAGDTLYYIALADRGYFVVNNQVIPEELNKTVNDAIVAIWLDPKVDLGRQLVMKKTNGTQNIHIAEYDPDNSTEINVVSPIVEEKALTKNTELTDTTATTEQAVDLDSQEQVKTLATTRKQPVVGVPTKAIETAEIQAVEKSENLANAAQAEENAEASSEKIEQVSPEEKLNEEKQEEKPKADPDNPEIDIRPIEDPMPENRRVG